MLLSKVVNSGFEKTRDFLTKKEVLEPGGLFTNMVIG